MIISEMGLGVSMVSGYFEMSCADNGFVLSIGLASAQNLMKCVWRPAGITLFGFLVHRAIFWHLTSDS